ncbi:MAG: PAS domain S-box protein [Thermoanaerobaculia bacterium]|nr:PAS domain S-box protein [Thermoanaerobaculia bacterium]
MSPHWESGLGVLRLLLIEDSDTDAELLLRTLERAGFTVEAERVETADEMAAALDRQSFDLVISDHRLPAFSAREALNLYRERPIDAPFLVVSGTIGEQQAVELLRAGARDFFLKDQLSLLGNAVERELAEVENWRVRRQAEKERREAQTALARSESFLRMVIDQDPNLIFVKDREGRFVLANSAIADLYGTTVEGLVGKRDVDFHPEGGDGGSSSRLDDLAVMDSGNEVIVQECISDAQGDPRWFRTVKRPLADPDDRIDQLLGVSVDLTDLRRAEAELRRNEHLLRIFFESPAAMRGIVELVGDDIRHLSDNNASAAFFQRSREEMAGRLASELGVSNETLELWLHHYRRSRDEAAPVVFEYDHVDETHRLRLRAVVAPAGTTSSGGELFAYAVDDVTPEREAVAAIEASERRFRRVMEASPHGILLVDADGVLQLANGTAEAIFGYSQEELVGRDLEQLLLEPPSEDGDRRFSLRRHLTADEPRKVVEVRGRRKDGRQFPVELGLNPLDSEALVLATIVDLTDRRELEAQLQQAQKMEAVGRLAGGLAHDLNNVLSVILGAADLAHSDLTRDHPVQEMISEIAAAARRAGDLTRHLLAFSRQQVMHPRPLDLNAVVEQSVRLLTQMIGEDVEFRMELDQELGTVRADPTQMGQVLLNLAVNARDAMPEGGKLTFETSNVELDEDYVRLHAAGRAGSYVMLTVSDTGHGMDEATQARVFEPFFTTKEEGKGTGLGLSTVYGIVKQSDGFIWIYSEPGLGTTFRVYLPRVEELAESPVVGPETPMPERPSGETVLVVEDQPALRKMIGELLQRAGFRVLRAENADKALSVAMEHEGRIDLLLTDVVMPGRNGWELATELRDRRGEIRVLFMSGYSNGTIQDRGLLPEGMHLMEKPFSSRLLVQAVRQALEDS